MGKPYPQNQLLFNGPTLITEWTLRCDWLVTKFLSQDASDIPINRTMRDALTPLKSRAKSHIDIAEDVFGLIKWEQSRTDPHSVLHFM